RRDQLQRDRGKLPFLRLRQHQHAAPIRHCWSPLLPGYAKKVALTPALSQGERGRTRPHPSPLPEGEGEEAPSPRPSPRGRGDGRALTPALSQGERGPAPCPDA